MTGNMKRQKVLEMMDKGQDAQSNTGACFEHVTVWILYLITSRKTFFDFLTL